MTNTVNEAPRQQGIDPHSKRGDGDLVALDVKAIRRAGASLLAIGLAAALLSRDEGAFTEERLRTVYGIDRQRAPLLLRELLVAGFIEMRAGLYHIAAAHRREA